MPIPDCVNPLPHVLGHPVGESDFVMARLVPRRYFQVIPSGKGFSVLLRNHAKVLYASKIPEIGNVDLAGPTVGISGRNHEHAAKLEKQDHLLKQRGRISKMLEDIHKQNRIKSFLEGFKIIEIPDHLNAFGGGGMCSGYVNLEAPLLYLRICLF
mgnify:FL=1